MTDEGGEQKRKQPPLAFRSGTREVHNKLEKYRRAHLKECFDLLKRQLPSSTEEKKASNLSILHSALCYIQALKRKERELEHEMERLAREKIAHKQKLAVLKKEVGAQCDGVDFTKLLSDVSSTNASQPLQSQHQQQQQQTQLEIQSPSQVPIENNINCKVNDVCSPKNTVQTEQKLTTTRPSNPQTRTVVPVSVNGVKEVKSKFLSKRSNDFNLTNSIFIFF